MSEMKADFVCAFLANVPGIGEAQMELWRDPETGGLFAIESSFLDGKTEEMQSPYNPATTLKMPADEVSQAVRPKHVGSCIVFPFLQDDKTFFAKIDWGLLDNQVSAMTAVFKWLSRYMPPPAMDRLTGVENLIAALRDYAVDTLGYPEAVVFPGLKKEEPNAE